MTVLKHGFELGNFLKTLYIEMVSYLCRSNFELLESGLEVGDRDLRKVCDDDAFRGVLAQVDAAVFLLLALRKDETIGKIKSQSRFDIIFK